jgi:tRNA threonylcarbamoyladenosine biosynthesis protein TsaB
MSHIINIDTATETAFVNIAANGQVLQSLQNESQKDHGAFVQTAIAALLKNTGLTFTDIDAIAVTAGPGSYTGLRVGMASAKGLSYALNKPLIAVSTLELWASAVIQQSAGTNNSTLFCAMIDARRMEVFTAVYNAALTPVLAPVAMILNESSFAGILAEQRVIFLGNGAAKWQKICSHPNASFATVANSSSAMAGLSYMAFLKNQFADLAYTEPFYLKEFQNNA